MSESIVVSVSGLIELILRAPDHESASASIQALMPMMSANLELLVKCHFDLFESSVQTVSFCLVSLIRNGASAMYFLIANIVIHMYAGL